MIVLETVFIIAVILICSYILLQQNRRYRDLFSRFVDDDAIPENENDYDSSAYGPATMPATTRRKTNAKLNVNAARKAIPKSDAAPASLRDYSFGEAIADTGIFPNWHVDHRALGELCETVMSGLWYAYHHPDTQDANLCVAVAENFIEKYAAALDAKRKKSNSGGSLKGFPWGGNWYQFSITSTAMLAYYLLLPINGAARATAIRLIGTLIVNPKLSLGWARDGSNMILMSGPWLLAKYLNGTLAAALESREYRDVVDSLSIKFTVDALANGLHLDYSYVAHNSIVAPGYYTSMVSPLTLYFYKLDPQIVSSPERLYANIKRIIFHESIPIGPIGYCGRANDMHSRLSELEADHGIRVMPFARFLRMFTPKCQFAVRGMRMNLGCYEADQTTDNTAQYWIQYRNVHTAASSTKCVWPNFGFIHRADKPEQLVVLPSRATTTEIYYPTEARSFVMRYDPYGVLWQRYRMEELAPDVTITEYIIVEYARSVTVRVRVENRHASATYHYYGAEKSQLARFEIPPNATRAYKTTFSLTDDGVSSVDTILLDRPEAVDLPIRISADLQIRDVSTNFAVLYDRDAAKVCSPYELAQECTFLPVKNKLGKHSIFRFNREVNQYTM